MLKLTRKLEYALIALRHIRQSGNNLCSAKEISVIYMIPKELLAKTLQQMAKLNYIKAVQGPRGGYKIRKGLEKVSMTQFIEELEGPLGMVDCNISSDCVQIGNCNIRMPINKINDNIRNMFNDILVSDITNQIIS